MSGGALRGDVLIRVRLRPSARRNALAGERGGALLADVTAPPERGKANRALVALLADALGLPRSAVAVVRGAHVRDKTVAIRGVRKEDLLRAPGIGAFFR
ncbi:MAG: DUF167 family protein [bacterium]|nr:DUF167 family protein [bacterium]